MNNGHWKFPEQMGVGGYHGFIYVIRDNFMGGFYLGKKQFGRLDVGGRFVSSDWKQYITSSKFMEELLMNRPKKEFEFICLEQYKTKGTFSYAETWSLCHVEAPTSSKWYNTRIEKVSWKIKEPITDRHKERLEKALMMAPFEE
jgi:hypothetical protein